MKKKTKVVSAIALFVLLVFLSAITILIKRLCLSKSGETTIEYIKLDGYLNSASAKDGIFYIYINEEGSYFIRYIDYESGSDVAVCNKPDCAHKDSSCNSYYCSLNENKYISDLFVYNEKLYVCGNDGITDAAGTNSISIYEQDFDGENRKKLLTTENEAIQDIMIYKNKIIFTAAYIDRSTMKKFEGVSFDSISNEDYYELNRHQCVSLYMYDIELGEFEVLKEDFGEQNKEGLVPVVIPSDDENGFYWVENYTQNGNEMYNFYYYNLESNTLEAVWNTLNENEIKYNPFCNSRMYNGHLYYNGYTGDLYSDTYDRYFCDYNTETGELKIIADLPGGISEEFQMDNKLFFNLGYGEDTDYACLYQRWVYFDITDGKFYVPKEGGHYPKYSSGDEGVVDYTDYYSAEVLGQDFTEYDYVITDMESYYKKYQEYNNEYADALILR